MADQGAGKLPRLRAAVKHHYKQLEGLRESREKLLEVAAGSLYPHAESYKLKDILNLMRQAAEAQTLSLAANRPRIIAVASTLERANFAEHYKNALNAYAKTMRLEEALQECARNAFYSLGIAQIHMADSVAVELEADEWMDPGKPFVQSVSPHHFCYDTAATDWRHCSFLANRYQVRFEEVVNDVRFPAKVRTMMKERGPEAKNEQQQNEWGGILGGGGDNSRFEESIYLSDVFLPKEGTVFTYVTNSQFELIGNPLRELDWDGSETGPYRFLNLGPVPDKTTPSSPAMNLLLQHNLVNSVYRKLEDQAVRQKIVNVGRTGDDDDIEKMRAAKDGDYVSLSAGAPIEQIRMDGPDQPVFGFALNAMEQFSKQAGNLDHKLGLAAGADTAAQQGMIGQGVSRVEAHYQGIFVKFVREVVQELGRLLFDDATTEIQMTKKVEGTSFEVDAPWLGAIQEGAREGRFQDYDLDIEPYSMEYRSPKDRMAELDAQIQMMVPLVPLMMQQGKMIDLDWWLKKRGEYSDMPEMQRLVMDIPQPDEQQQGGSHERTLAGGQGGEYTHTNVNGSAPSGPDPMQLMSSGGEQQ